MQDRELTYRSSNGAKDGVLVVTLDGPLLLGNLFDFQNELRGLKAPCLILDDALVYADEARFEIMKTILQRAARDLQILVLTCRPREYFGLDACYLRLENCRQS